MKRDPFA